MSSQFARIAQPARTASAINTAGCGLETGRNVCAVIMMATNPKIKFVRRSIPLTRRVLSFRSATFVLISSRKHAFLSFRLSQAIHASCSRTLPSPFRDFALENANALSARLPLIRLSEDFDKLGPYQLMRDIAGLACPVCKDLLPRSVAVARNCG